MENYVHPPQNEADIQSLFYDGYELMDRLVRAGHKTDRKLLVEVICQPKWYVPWRRKPGREYIYVDAWEIPNLPDEDLDEIALGTDGVLYIFYAGFSLQVNGEEVMWPTHALSHFHLQHWITVKEMRDRLQAYEAKHLAA